MANFLSIGIPARNEEESIERAVNSLIKSSIWKATPSERKELIICVNGSTDNTLSISQHLASKIPEIKIIYLKRGCKNSAINKITQTSNPQAKAIYFSDADSLVHERTVERTLQELEQTQTAKFAAPLCTPAASFLPPTKRSPTQAFYVEASRVGKKEQVYQLSGQGYAADRTFLLSHPLPNTNRIGDDRYINTMFKKLVKVVYSTSFVYKEPSLIDHTYQRIRQKRQRRRLEQIFPETAQAQKRKAKEVNPRQLRLIKALSGKALVGLALNQGAELTATVLSKAPVRNIWPKIKSTKLRRK